MSLWVRGKLWVRAELWRSPRITPAAAAPPRHRTLIVAAEHRTLEIT